MEAELINKAWVFRNCLFIFSRFHYLPIKVFIKVFNSPQEISSPVWVSTVSHVRMRLSERQSCYGPRNGVKLATICHKFSFDLRPDEGKYWKVMFQKQKMFDNRPSWAVPNFHNWMWTTFQMLTKQEQKYWVLIRVDTLTFDIQWIRKRISDQKHLLWCSGKLLLKRFNK